MEGVKAEERCHPKSPGAHLSWISLKRQANFLSRLLEGWRWGDVRMRVLPSWSNA